MLRDVFVPVMVMFCLVVFVCEQYDKQQNKARRLQKELEECQKECGCELEKDIV